MFELVMYSCLLLDTLTSIGIHERSLGFKYSHDHYARCSIGIRLIARGDFWPSPIWDHGHHCLHQFEAHKISRCLYTLGWQVAVETSKSSFMGQSRSDHDNEKASVIQLPVLAFLSPPSPPRARPIVPRTEFNWDLSPQPSTLNCWSI